MSLEED